MLLKVTVNGQSYLVDAASKAAAKNFGKTKLEVTVEAATAADITANGDAPIEVVVGKAKSAPVEGAEQAAA